MPKKYKLIEGIRIGRPRVKPTTPGHVRGTITGNNPGNYEKSPGHLRSGRSTARRSTGINAENRNPILPGMPNLSPP